MSALATLPAAPTLPTPAAWDTMLDMAGHLVKSGLLPSHIRTPQAAVALILKGQELQIPPMLALTNIVVIEGKPTANAELMLALIYRAQGDNAIRVLESSATLCRLTYRRRGWGQAAEFAYTHAEATQAGLTGRKVWKEYPGAMLRARAISAVARMAFPDVIGGLYTPEELGAVVTLSDAGETIVTGSWNGAPPPADDDDDDTPHWPPRPPVDDEQPLFHIVTGDAPLPSDADTEFGDLLTRVLAFAAGGTADEFDALSRECEAATEWIDAQQREELRAAYRETQRARRAASLT